MPQEDILQPIPVEKLPELRELFNNSYGKHIYYFITNYINWLQKNPETKVQFLCPNGDWSDGTFVAIAEEAAFNIIIFTLDKTNNRLEKALIETNLIDWNRGPLINYIHFDHYDIIDNFIKVKNLQIAAQTNSTIYRLDADEARKIEYSCDSDVYVAKLTSDHADIINDEWIYKHAGSEKYINKLITMNGGFGIFGIEDNKLRAWALGYDNGGLGTLHTMDEHRRKGYAKIVVKAFCKDFGEQNKDIVIFASQTNVPSRSLFESCGFKLISLCRFVYILDTITYKNANLNWR